MQLPGTIAAVMTAFLLAACGRGEDAQEERASVAQVPAVAPVSTTSVMGGPASGADVYARACAMCHEAGVANAPRTDDPSAWAPRIARGKGKLYMHAIDGYLGEKGIMPPKGGHPALPEADVRAAVDHIVAQVERK